MLTDDLPEDGRGQVQESGPGLFLTGQTLPGDTTTKKSQPACPVLLSSPSRDHQSEKLEQLDKDYAEQQKAKIEPEETTLRWRQRFSEPYWSFHESLSLAVHGVPQKLHAINSGNCRAVRFYGDKNCQLRHEEFLREWRLGAIKAFIRGEEILPAAAVYPARLLKDPDLVFDANTIKAKWLTADDEPNEIQSTIDAGANNLWKRLIAEQVTADDLEAPAVLVDDLTVEEINSLSKLQQQNRDKRCDRLNSRGKEGVVTRIRKQHPELLQDAGELAWDQMFPVSEAEKSKKKQGRTALAVLKRRVAVAHDWLLAFASRVPD
jgi:hypothetical protein